MLLVADANILISAFVRDGMTRHLWFDRRLRLFAPRFILAEFKRHFPQILAKSGLDPKAATRLSELLLARMTFIEEAELLPYLSAAKHITSDGKDEPYAACALAVNADLWSADRHLKQPRIKCWTTSELAEKMFQ